jgi:hypothetical protein
MGALADAALIAGGELAGLCHVRSSRRRSPTTGSASFAWSVTDVQEIKTVPDEMA